MAISVVQFKAFTNATSGSFNSNVSTGNTVILTVQTYNTSGSTISVTSPQYNGASVTGAAQLFGLQNAGSTTMFSAAWMLPDVGSSGASVSFTLTNGNVDANMGFTIMEVSGLGSSPALDTTTPNPATASGAAGGTVTSGSTGNIVSSPDLIVGVAMNNNSGVTPSGAPWTTLTTGGATGAAGYQIATSSGAGYAFGLTGGTGGEWSAGVAAIKTSAVTAISGMVQSLATVPVPRRRLARAVSRSITGQAFVAVAAPRQEPATPPRRRPARAVVGFVPVTTTNASPHQAGTVQPTGAQPAPRRKPSRAVVGFVPVQTFNTGHGPAGTVQPAATVPVPRRRPARAVVQFVPVATFNTGHGPAGTVQPLAAQPAPRRRPARAYIQFTPVKTTNGAAVPPKPQRGTPPSDEGRSYKRWLLWGA